MLQWVVRADRLERVETDDELDRRRGDPGGAQTLEQLRGEVQTSSRSGG